MDILSILGSINKIGLAAFFIMLGFLGYEIYLLLREKKTKSAKVNVPQFSGTAVLNFSPAPGIEANNDSYRMIKVIMIGAILMAIGIALLVGIWSILQDQNQTTQIPQTQIVQVVKSNGIRILDKSYKLLSDTDLLNLQANDEIIIGVEMIGGSDVDKARILVNKDEWTQKDETGKFHKEQNVFYISYILKSAEPQLKIRAQLHSRTVGWLGD